MGALIPALPFIISALSTATSVVGAAIEGGGKGRQAQDVAKQAARNARMARFRRDDVFQRGALVAGQIASEGSRRTASLRAAAARSGVVGESQANIFTVSDIAARRDELTTLANAARIAWGEEQQAVSFLERKRQAERAGILGRVGTGFNVASSLVRGISNVAKV